MYAVTHWANQHDWAKLLLITLALGVIMLLVEGMGESVLLFVLLLSAIGLCGVVAYWLGNWKWILIPLLAMLVFIILAVPAVMIYPDSGETPFSMIIESPFWAGLPAFIGAGAGMGIYQLVQARRKRQA